jgi:hypothetical protein
VDAATDTLDCRVAYSLQRHGGYFARVQFTLSPIAAGVEVESPPGVAAWTVPACEWGRLIPWQAERLPAAWRDPAGRPPTPGDEPWVGAIRRGVAEWAAWWAERGTAVAARLTLTAVWVHPTDTSEAVCEQLGREMLDEVVGRLAQRHAEPGAAPDRGRM